MAVSIQQAAEKWQAKTQNAGAKWAQNTQGKSSAYCEGLAKLGVNASACMSGAGARYSQGIAAVGASGYDRAIAGKAQKWATNFANGFSI